MENDAELEPTVEMETLPSDERKGTRCSKSKNLDSNAVVLDGEMYQLWD